MSHVEADRPAALSEPRDARDLQAALYREIGISAVAAALRFVNQPDPAAAKPVAERELPPFLKDAPKAA